MIDEEYAQRLFTIDEMYDNSNIEYEEYIKLLDELDKEYFENEDD